MCDNIWDFFGRCLMTRSNGRIMRRTQQTAQPQTHTHNNPQTHNSTETLFRSTTCARASNQGI